MNLHEYQGKALMQQYGISVPKGAVASSAADAVQAARTIGEGPWYVKAQVLAGGRASGHFKHCPGSEGGVRRCDSLQQVGENAADMLEQVLFTVQTGLEGVLVHQVYVEAAVELVSESYLALLVDRRSSCITLMTSRSGGAFIEQSYASNPESLVLWVIDIEDGLDSKTVDGAAESLGFNAEGQRQCADLVRNLYAMFVEKDCSLIEINPLACSASDEICVLDATVKIDANALYRQRDLIRLRDTRDLRDGELDALKYGFNYFKLEGNIGIVASGASMAMATLDTVKLYGGEPANFLDIPPVGDANLFLQAMKLALSDPSINVVLVNIFGGGVLRCDAVANALLMAVAQTDQNLPIIVRLAGTRADAGREMLAQVSAKMNISLAPNMVEASQTAVQVAQQQQQATVSRRKRASWWSQVLGR